MSRTPVGLAVARERYRSGLSTDTANGTLVGIVGASVPVELVVAAGMMPVRLGGRPRATPLADVYRLDRLDAPTTVAFEQLLDPARPFEFAIIGGDGESHSLLFQVLREIRREERSRRLPRFMFVDVLHLRHRTTSRYDRGQLRRLLATLENWCGRRITSDDVRQAVATVNETRRLLAAAMAFRHARPARLSGTDALHLIGAALMSSPAEVRSWVSGLVAEAPGLPELTGTRVYLTGSAHEDSAAYEALESHGWVIVGEDHQWGEDALGPEIESTADPLDGLVEHYQFANLPSRRSSTDRARHVADATRAADADLVAHLAFAHDEATPWDRPAISEAVAVAGLSEIRLPEQRFGQVDRDELARAIDSLGLTGARGKR